MSGVNYDVPKAVQRSHGHRIDQIKLFGGGDLDQTQTGMVGLFTDEFRIEAELWTRGKVGATRRQLLWLGDDHFGKVSLSALGHHESWVARRRSRSCEYPTPTRILALGFRLGHMVLR